MVMSEMGFFLRNEGGMREARRRKRTLSMERINYLAERMLSSERGQLLAIAEEFTAHPHRSFILNVLTALKIKLRLAVWFVDSENRCQHKTYVVSDTDHARIGELAEGEWIEAWII